MKAKGSDNSFVAPDPSHGMIVVCEVGAAPRGRPNLRLGMGCAALTGWQIPSHAVFEKEFPFYETGGHRDPPLRGDNRWGRG